MPGFSKILVPLDGSRLAEAVLPVVTSMARAFKASLSLLHVLEQGAPETVHGERHLTDARSAEEYLAQVAAGCDCEGLSVALHVHPNPERDVVASILGHAGEFGADLIVLATHGWGGMRDLLVGSVAQQVLKRGTVPVLLVKPSPEHPTVAPYPVRRLLVPLDGTRAHDDAVLPVVEDVARAFGAEARLMLVVPTLETVSADQAPIARLTPQATAAALDLEQQDAAAYLGQLARQLRGKGVSASAEVRRGDPVGTVLDVASEDADLVIMSTHARAGLEALWSASVGSKLLQRLRPPLLLVRAG